MAESSTCGYEACRCERPYSPQTIAAGTRKLEPNAKYCSERCQQLSENPQFADACECAHPGCTPQATPDIPPMQ